MGPLEEQQAINAIASSLPRFFPEDWKAAIYHVRIMGLCMEEYIEVEKEAGGIIRTELPVDSGMKCMKLRAGMFRENQGTWFSFDLKLWSNGKYRSEFNYEDPPNLLFGVNLREYTRDVRIFPRTEEFTPTWLREKLEEANSARGG
ncbi:hypothetical protein ACFWTE_06160 [Nocardiopsis sp. NPDC058631]|uniref:hypothetical protein n=1 Tax=Nocardiopsis sp. NPDC058631 TaxID=3346566 RepID=UPI0036653263